MSPRRSDARAMTATELSWARARQSRITMPEEWRIPGPAIKDSDEPGSVVDGDDEEDREGLDAGDREDVDVRRPMRQPGDGEQRDHGAVVRQGVHAAARHGRDAVEDLERNVRRPRRLDEAIR